MSLPNVQVGDPHVAAHNDEREVINELQELTEEGRLSEEELSASYVRFRDQDGNPLPAGSVTTIKVNTTTGQIDDIIFTPGA